MSEHVYSSGLKHMLALRMQLFRVVCKLLVDTLCQ